MSRPRARTSSVVLAASFAAAGCEATPHPAPAPAPLVLSASAAPSAPPGPPEPDATAALLPYVVVHPKAARRVLYTWTTLAQIAALGRDPTLLTRSESPSHGASYFDQVMAERAAAGDAFAKMLRTAAFARSRHAWPAPWATHAGWPGETYGDELLRVELQPDAWIAIVRTSQAGSAVVDLDDRPVALAEALLHPERIAAVYFVHDVVDSNPQPSNSTFSGSRIPTAYREYVLCNESKIASWSTGTPAIGHELRVEADALDAYARHLGGEPPTSEEMYAWREKLLRATWPDRAPPPAETNSYEAALAFPNELYFPAAARIAALASKLRAIAPEGPGSEHRPTAVFPKAIASAPTPAPTPRPRRMHGTF